MKKSIIIAGITIVAVAVIMFLYSKESAEDTGITIPSPSQLESPAVTPSAGSSPTKTPPVQLPDNARFDLPTPIPRALIKGPAACQLSGSIQFRNENLYESKQALIKYQNVDDHSRFIFWKVTPDDGALRPGPNIFSQLTLPNGQREVGVSLIKPATVKQYTLTASVTYGVIKADGAEEIKESRCSGAVAVTMPAEN